MDALDELLADFDVEPPMDPTERLAWIDERSAKLGELMAEAAAIITRNGVEAYAATLVAAGDVSALDAMSTIWRTFVTEVVGEYTAGMYLGGNLSTFIAGPGSSLGPEDAAGWASVVNKNAAEYQASATNRIVGASQDMWGDVRAKTVESINSGMSGEKLKSGIEDITGYSEFRADTIGRTEAQSAFNGGQLDGARALGEFGPQYKRWMSVGDSRTRKTHKAADEQVVAIDDKFEIGTSRMDRPLDRSAPPEESINCRCLMELLWVEDLSDAERERLGLEAEAVEPVADAWEFSDDPAVIDERISDLPEYPTFRDTTPQRQYQEVRDGRTEFNSYEVDQIMIDIARKSGADAKPTVLTSAEFEAQANIVSRRGFGNARAADQFVDGAYEPGVGLKGNGYYSTQNFDEGTRYSTKLGGDTKGGRVLKLGLRDDARIISIDDLDDQMDRLGDRVPDWFRDDPNRWALAQGYDAVHVPRKGGDWYLMLNRSRVLVDGGA